MRTAIGLLLASILGLGLGGCSDDDADRALDDARDRANEAIEQAQDVDWGSYPADVREDVEEAIAEADCEELDEQLGRLDEGRDRELIAFLRDQLEDAGCA